MATVAQAIVDQVEVLLQDPSNTRWSTSELLNYLSEGQRLIVNYKPDANTRYLDYNLLNSIAPPGGTGVSYARLVEPYYDITKGSLFDDASGEPGADPLALRIIDIPTNMNAFYAHKGALGPDDSIRLTTEEELSTQIRGWWRSRSFSSDVRHWMIDPLRPTCFRTYPRPGGFNAAVVRVRYAKIPDVMTSLSSNIEIPDIFQTSLIDYMLFRAYGKDGEASTNNELKMQYWNQFMTGLTLQSGAERATNPRAMGNIPMQGGVPMGG
jgi:hypothetical protein